MQLSFLHIVFKFETTDLADRIICKMLHCLMVVAQEYLNNKLSAKLSTPAINLGKQRHRPSLTFERNQETKAVCTEFKYLKHKNISNRELLR